MNHQLSRVRRPRFTKQAALFLLTVFVVGSLLMVGYKRAYSDTSPASDEGIAWQVLGRLNAWRLKENVPPLRFNPTLRDMAVAQDTYLVSLSSLPDEEGDFHKNAQGDLPPQRALKAPYNWISYGRADRTAVGENAALGNVDFALYFWTNSEIHRKTALN